MNDSTTPVANEQEEDYSIIRLTTEETRKNFDRMVRERLGISAEQFIKNFRAGEYDDKDECDIMSLLMMLPFTGYAQIYGNEQDSRSK